MYNNKNNMVEKHHISSPENLNNTSSNNTNKTTIEADDGIIFIGTGVSAALPQLKHICSIDSNRYPLFKLLNDYKSSDDDDNKRQLKLLLSSLPQNNNITTNNIENEKNDNITDDSIFFQQNNKILNNDNISKKDKEGETIVSLIRKQIENQGIDKSNGGCTACLDGWLRSYKSPNKRNNVSIIIRCCGGTKNILIDCGKTFREAAIHIFPKYGIKKIDALLLTHEHQDAVGGIDDIRDFQTYSYEIIEKINENKILINSNTESYTFKDNKFTTTAFSSSERLPTFLSTFCLRSISEKFQYIVLASLNDDCQVRKVAKLSFHILEDECCDDDNKDNMKALQKLRQKKILKVNNSSKNINISSPQIEEKQNISSNKNLFEEAIMTSELCENVEGYSKLCIPGAESLEIIAIPVWHGSDYRAMGFVFGKPDRVAYFSDISYFDKNALKKILPIKVLIIDALLKEREHFSHFSLKQSLEIVELFQPEHTYFIGMTCELEHYETTKFLEEWLFKYKKKFVYNECKIKSVQLAIDGDFLKLSLNTNKKHCILI